MATLLHFPTRAERQWAEIRQIIEPLLYQWQERGDREPFEELMYMIRQHVEAWRLEEHGYTVQVVGLGWQTRLVIAGGKGEEPAIAPAQASTAPARARNGKKS